MEGSYHHHHHGHAQMNSNTNEEQSVARTNTLPVRIPQINEHRLGGVQSASSFHSVSSLDSSAEMAKYFPDDPTPHLSPPNQQQTEQTHETQSIVTSVHSTAANNSGPYAAVQPQLLQPTQPSLSVPQQQAIKTAVAPQLPTGIPAYSSQIEGVSVSQTIVNDVIIDLQTKVINETQQQYYNDFTSGIPFEQLSPVYIRAPNPSIILRSDLHRLRAELKAKPTARHVGSVNHFQVPSFPPPY